MRILQYDLWDYSAWVATTLSDYSTMYIVKGKRNKLKVGDYSLLSTSGKQPSFNVVLTSKHNVEQRQISTLKLRQISTFKQRHIPMLKQRHISTLIRFNEIECLFNVEVRRCFNLYLPSVEDIFSSFKEIFKSFEDIFK